MLPIQSVPNTFSFPLNSQNVFLLLLAYFTNISIQYNEYLIHNKILIFECKMHRNLVAIAMFFKSLSGILLISKRLSEQAEIIIFSIRFSFFHCNKQKYHLCPSRLSQLNPIAIV